MISPDQKRFKPEESRALHMVDFIGKRPAVFIALAVIATLGVSYLTALAGEPRAVWIWRDVLGVI